MKYILYFKSEIYENINLIYVLIYFFMLMVVK